MTDAQTNNPFPPNTLVADVTAKEAAGDSAGSVTVASTIRQQIMALDFWALANWGANSYSATDKSLTFKTSGRNAARGIYVRVTLTPADLYTVELIRLKRFSLKYLARLEGVYDQMLVDVIQGMLNDKRKPNWLSQPRPLGAVVSTA